MFRSFAALVLNVIFLRNPRYVGFCHSEKRVMKRSVMDPFFRKIFLALFRMNIDKHKKCKFVHNSAN